MSIEKQELCGLCLKITNFSKCRVPDQTLIEKLEVLHIQKLGLSRTENPKVCSICLEKVNSAFNFKMTCLESGTSRMSSTTTQVDHSHSENGNKCLFCNTLVFENSAVLLSEMLKENTMMETFQKYMPEIDLQARDNSVICNICQASLSDFNKFINLISGVDAQYKENKYIDQLLDLKNQNLLENDISSVRNKKEKYLDSNLLTSNLKENNAEEFIIEITKDDIYIESKIEATVKKEVMNKDDRCSAEIKTETDSHLTFSDYTTLEAQVKEEVINDYNYTDDIKKEYISNDCITDSDLKREELNHYEYETFLLKNEEYELKSEAGQSINEKRALEETFEQNMERQETEIYQCQTCSFSTLTEWVFYKHLSKHKNSNGINILKCALCAFETKYSSAMKLHMLTHQSSGYQSKCKPNLNISTVMDNNTIMHSCQQCTYKTKYKSNLYVHNLIHKNRDEIKMHKCQHCTYQSKYKSVLKKHVLTHQNAEEVEMYKCMQCSYHSRFKNYIKRHMLTHKTSDKLGMHKCQQCTFETKNKKYLKRHAVSHKNDELKMLK